MVSKTNTKQKPIKIILNFNYTVEVKAGWLKKERKNYKKKSKKRANENKVLLTE